MICLAYFSSAAAPMDAAALGALLDRSRRNNAAAAVTGLLCHYDGSFLQFLEGPQEAVLPRFDVIRADPRHRDVLEVHRAPIAARAFAVWSMGLVNPSALGVAESAFCRRLGDIAISASAEHRDTIQPFLDIFRAWLR